MSAIRLLIVRGITLQAALLSVQSHSRTVTPAFFVTLGPETQQVQLGTKVKLKATIVSTADVFDVSGGAMVGCFGYLVHVERKGGQEPEKTEYYRHVLGDFRPGDGPDSSSGSCFARELNAGGTLSTTYDLSAFYQLTTPGKYEVWVQINDGIRDPTDGSVRTHPVRSNTAHLELVSGK